MKTGSSRFMLVTGVGPLLPLVSCLGSRKMLSVWPARIKNVKFARPYPITGSLTKALAIFQRCQMDKAVQEAFAAYFKARERGGVMAKPTIEIETFKHRGVWFAEACLYNPSPCILWQARSKSRSKAVSEAKLFLTGFQSGQKRHRNSQRSQASYLGCAMVPNQRSCDCRQRKAVNRSPC